MRMHLPYLEVCDSCAVKGTGPEDGCFIDSDITLETTRFDVVLGLLLILNEGTVLEGAVLMRLKINTHMFTCIIY